MSDSIETSEDMSRPWTPPGASEGTASAMRLIGRAAKWEAFGQGGKPLGCPGWEVHFDGVGCVQYQPIVADGDVVAFAVDRSSDPFARLSTSHARQIAAAPEMLDALRHLTDVCRRMESESDELKPTEDEYQRALEDANFAVLLATGCQP